VEKNGTEVIPYGVLFGSDSVMVWTGISLQISTDHVFLRQSRNANRDVSGILEDYVITFSHYIGRILFLYKTLQDHNTSNIVTQYLRDGGISPMKYPSYKSDLYSLEYIWVD
jgi:hypothetical protein